MKHFALLTAGDCPAPKLSPGTPEDTFFPLCFSAGKKAKRLQFGKITLFCWEGKRSDTGTGGFDLEKVPEGSELSLCRVPTEIFSDFILLCHIRKQFGQTVFRIITVHDQLGFYRMKQ
ncbi:MAG: hypothetical protein R2941_10250 [Desulfobacterales bacterium]